MIFKTLGVVAGVVGIVVVGALPAYAYEWGGSGATGPAAVANAKNACEAIGFKYKKTIRVDRLPGGGYFAAIDCV